MNLFELLALLAVGFLAGAATATVRVNNRRPIPERPVNRIDPFFTSRN